MDTTRFGDKVGIEIVKQGLSIRQLAQVTGISKTRLSKIVKGEAGDYEIRLSDVKEIAKALNVSEEMLLASDEELLNHTVYEGSGKNPFLALISLENQILSMCGTEATLKQTLHTLKNGLRYAEDKHTDRIMNNKKEEIA